MHCRRAVNGVPTVPRSSSSTRTSSPPGPTTSTLGVYDISKDHRLCLYGIDTDGDEKYELYLIDIESERAPASLGIGGVSAGSAWDNAGTSFFYVRPDETSRPSEVWRHLIGTDPVEDRCVYVEPDPQFFLGLGKDRDDSFIHITLGSAVTDEIRLIPADDPGSEPIVVITTAFRYRVRRRPSHRARRWGPVLPPHQRRRRQLQALVGSRRGGAVGLDPAGELDRGRRPPGRRDARRIRCLRQPSGSGRTQQRAAAVTDPAFLRRGRARDRSTRGGEHGLSREPIRAADTVDFRYIYTSMVTPPTVYSYDMDRRARTILKQTARARRLRLGHLRHRTHLGHCRGRDEGADPPGMAARP